MKRAKSQFAQRFDGFVSGVELTPVPSPLLSDLLVAFDDLSELKLALRIVWLLHRKPATERFLTADELAGDEVAAAMLDAYGAELNRKIESILQNLRQAQIILQAYNQGKNFYMLNNEPSRQLVNSGRFVPVRRDLDLEAPPTAGFRRGSAEIVRIYEANIGALTPLAAERLNELLHQYLEADILAAIKTAVLNGAPNLSYINAILRSGGKRDGKHQQRHRAIPEVSEREYFGQRDRA